jgi:hypothetical protein
MTHRVRRFLFCLFLMLPAWPGLAAPAHVDETWMSVLLEGRKIGTAHYSRTVDGDRVTTRQSLQLEFERNGSPLKVENTEIDVEDTRGTPFGFDTLTRISGSDSTVHGERLADGRFKVTRTVGGVAHTAIVDWPDGALLAEGQRLAERRAGLVPGTVLRFDAYDADSGDALRMLATVIGTERVELPGGTGSLVHVRQVTRLPVGETRNELWLDAHFNLRKMRLEVFGQPLEMLACSRTCAEAPNQSGNLFDHAMARLPHTLSPTQLDGALRYVMAASDDRPLHFAETDEQRVQREKNNRWIVVVVGASGARREAPPAPADTAANAWLQSDNAEIIALARQAAGDARDNEARMQRLTDFVRGYIADKNLGVGYASALETVHSRQGDCTEHAVLLAALGRALGIPVRVLTGLAYVPHYAGADAVLVPHAWVQAWVDGRWRSYDAALGRFDAGHIALDIGDGDPWKFFAGLDTLGRIEVRQMRPLAR